MMYFFVAVGFCIGAGWFLSGIVAAGTIFVSGGDTVISKIKDVSFAILFSLFIGVIGGILGAVPGLIVCGAAQQRAGYEQQTRLVRQNNLRGIDTRTEKQSKSSGGFFLILGGFNSESGEYQYYHYYEETSRGYQRRKTSTDDTKIYFKEESRDGGIVEHWVVEKIPVPVSWWFEFDNQVRVSERYTVLRIPNGSIQINEFNVD